MDDDESEDESGVPSSLGPSPFDSLVCLRTLTVSTGCIAAVLKKLAANAAPYTIAFPCSPSRDSSTLRCNSL